VKFIVIDGLDAAGKSTQALKLRDELLQKGKTVCLRMHPTGDNYFGRKSKEFLYGKTQNAFFVSAIFFMLDVAHSVLLSFHRGYDYVVFVRYLMSSAYFPRSVYRAVYHFFSVFFPTPSVTFILDVSPAEAYTRITLSHEEKEMFENVEQLQKVRLKILDLAYLNGWIIINASQSQEKIEQQIARTV
jgi:dTMP kinase